MRSLVAPAGPQGPGRRGGFLGGAAAAMLGFAALAALAGCVDTGESEAQLAYDACVDAYNDTFRTLPGPKAMVAGVDGDHYQCFWSYSAGSTAAAQNSAMNNCHAKFQRCFVFATSNGLSNWAQQISDNGGRDPGNLGNQGGGFAGGSSGGGSIGRGSPGGGSPGGARGGNGDDDGDNANNGGGPRLPCHVDAIANIDQRQPPGTCSIRNMTSAQCSAYAQNTWFKPDNGSGFTECFYPPQ